MYRGYKVEKGRLGWDIYLNGKHVHATANQTEAMEWCDAQIERKRNAV